MNLIKILVLKKVGAKIYLLLFFSIFMETCFAQDTVYISNKKPITGDILRIGTNTIRFKIADPRHPKQAIRLQSVDSIVYKNGERTYFPGRKNLQEKFLAGSPPLDTVYVDKKLISGRKIKQPIIGEIKHFDSNRLILKSPFAAGKGEKSFSLIEINSVAYGDGREKYYIPQSVVDKTIKKYKRQIAAGIGLTAAGGTLLAIGIVGISRKDADILDKDTQGFALFTILGSAGLPCGVFTIIKRSKKLNNLKHRFSIDINGTTAFFRYQF